MSETGLVLAPDCVQPPVDPPDLPDHQRAAAVELGWEVLNRIRRNLDPENLLVPHPVTGELRRSWHPLALDEGDLGVALVYSAADRLRPDDGWDRAAFEHVRRALDCFGRSGPDIGIGLFSGAAAVGHVLRSLSRDGTRYRQARRAVDEALRQRLAAHVESLPPDGLATEQYDVISGVAGAARYLLQWQPLTEADADAAAGAVAALCRQALRPEGFHTPPERVTELERRTRPKLRGGYVNLGYAHGIAGVLATLGLARRRGIAPAGLDDAVAELAGTLRDAVRDTLHGPDLPYQIVPDAAEDPASPLTPTRSAWCYGNVGAALALAECARTDPTHHATVDVLLEAMRGRPVEVLADANPSLCHGVGGLLPISRHIAASTTDPAARARATATLDDGVGRLLAMRADYMAFGLDNQQVGPVATDSPGFLTGSGGAAVALISLGSGEAEPTPAEQLLCGGDAC